MVGTESAAGCSCGDAAFSTRAPNAATSASGWPGRPGKPPGFDPKTYRKRNVAERCVSRFEQWRGTATRREKRAANYRAMVVIAALIAWLSP